MFLLATEQQVFAETYTFDFNTGPGPSFSTFNSGDLFTLDLDGPDLRVSKLADAGSFLPTGFVSGGITSKFSTTGDFIVTVDFDLLNFPVGAPGSNPLNESVLTVNGDNPGESFLVLRFRTSTSDQIEAYGSSGGPTGVQDSALTSGRYQIERVGDTLTGRFSPTGSGTFTTLGSFSGYTSSKFNIQLGGTQGVNLAGAMRSTTALDVSFDNLVVEADGFVGGVALLNISTRLRVQSGENVLIGGFIVTGTDPKKVIIRGIGPSLAQFFSGSLPDPTLELYQGSTLLAMNDNWKTDQQAEIEATGIPPSHDLEGAIVRILTPAAYTAIVRGNGNTTGIGVVEAYDLDQTANSRLANISTRGFVETGDNVMIGGLIVGPTGGLNAKVVVRAIGPSLSNFGISGALQDLTLDLVNSDGVVIRSNDDWRDSQQAEIEAVGLQPSDDRESALVQTVAPGNYTAIVRGVGNTTGVGLVEVYHVQ